MGTQIGPDYTYNTDATIPAATNRKLIILAKKNATQAATVAKFLGIGDTVPGLNLSGGLDQLDAHTRNLIQTQFSQELAIARGGISSVTGNVQNTASGISGSIQGAAQEFAGDISDVRTSITGGLAAAKRDISEAMQPVSTTMGDGFANLAGVARDPLGAISQLPQGVLSVIRSVSPDFAADLERTFKSEKMRNFTNLPTQIAGSVSNLLTAADAIISLPLVIMSDLYRGLMVIMQEISKLVDEVIAGIIDFVFGPGGLLDSILPIAEILEFLEAVGELASEVQGISTIFLGANDIAGFSLNIQTISNQLGSALSNPADLLFAYLPPQVNQALYTIRNPQQFVNSLIPPELTQQFAKLSQITGFGFNGNMGYGFQSVLEGLRGGVIGSILGDFANQYPILDHLVSVAGPTASQSSPYTSFPPRLEASSVGAQPTTQGVVQPQKPPKEVIPTKTPNETGTSNNQATTDSITSAPAGPAVSISVAVPPNQTPASIEIAPPTP